MEEEFHLSKPVHHVAFIMDGNGRWAKERGKPRYLGHKEGCERIVEIMVACEEFGIDCMTLYAFSTENWKRPKDEINHLFNYLGAFFKREIKRMIRDGFKVMTSGDLSRLPLKTQKIIEESKELTKDCNKFIFNICLNYGSRDEIVRGAKLFANDVLSGKVGVDSLTTDSFSSYLYTAGLPEVDLLIRTSGEYRISNYLLYQLAYAEFVFPKTYWPDFHRHEFILALKEYESRDRRYGGLKND